MARNVAAGIVLALLVVTSGCVGFLSGPVSFSASAATVNDAALEQTGYEHNRTRDLTVTRNFSVAGQSKRVEVTNKLSEYHRSVGVPGVGERRVAAFVTFASPQVDVLGQSFNPLSKYDNRQLAEQFTAQLKSVGNLRKVGEREATMLGKTTTVTKFEATVTTVGGLEFDANVHVTKVKHGDDYVVAIAVHPKRLSGHQSKVDTLIEGVEHEQ
ncbi:MULTISPECIES: DUF6517 family protein [Halorussus]|uniref:DUF6517 family protein n=1 Tax=Halorussus TaxID=1070314 RepID=UPI0020A21B01|nr:DUF6517 family protein [Halorussus vallis]USZ76038.1 DUF6517 family protein [Halorussus vallis]